MAFSQPGHPGDQATGWRQTPAHLTQAQATRVTTHQKNTASGLYRRVETQHERCHQTRYAAVVSHRAPSSAMPEPGMGRNYLAGQAGDAINPVLAAVGYNFHRLLVWFAYFRRDLL